MTSAIAGARFISDSEENMQLNRMPLPAAYPDDGPQIQFCMNKDWFYVVMSILESLEYEGSWDEGTDMNDALGKVYTLTGMLALADGECETMPQEYIKNIGPCDELGHLLYTAVIDGIESVGQYIDISACIPVPSTYLKSYDGCSIGVMNFTQVINNVESTISEDIGACLDGVIVGEPGPQGEQGIQGIPGVQGNDGIDGAQGIPGECMDCEPAAPTPGQTSNDHCGAATYLVNWLDDRFDDVLGVMEVISDAAAFVDSVVELFGPFDIAIAGIPGLLSESAGLASSVLRANVNSVVLENMRCSLYCALETAGNTSYQTVIDWAEAENAAAGANVGLHVWLSLLINVFPATEVERRVYIGSLSTSTECAALCDCDDTPPDDDCDEFDFTTGQHGFNVVGLHAGYVAGQGFKITGTGSNTIDLQAPLKAGTVKSVLVEATGTSADNRVYVSLTNPGGTPKDTGIAPYFMDNLNIVVTNVRLRIAHDWTPGNTPAGTAVITKITICYV